MKRLISFLLALLVLAPSVVSQAAEYTADGYYRVRNYGTQRYVYVTDNTGSYDKARTTGDFGAMQLWRGQERTISDPASVIYIEKHGDEMFDLTAQGTGVYALVGMYVNVKQNTSGAFAGLYTVGASAYGFDKYLCDQEAADVDDGVMGTERDGKYRQWEVFPVSADNDDCYFGITPTVQLGDTYYQPFYAAFPFNLHSAGLKAYIVTMVDAQLGLAVLKQVEGTVPAATPVLVECTSASPSANRLDLLKTGPAAPANNQLRGVYFCNNGRPKSPDALTAFDATTMRVLGLTAEGKLGFVSTSDNLVSFRNKSGLYLPANQSYLSVPADAPAELTLVSEEEYQEIVRAAREHTLTYLVDGEVYATQTVLEGTPITPLEPPTKEGYTFSGWDDEPETMPAHDVTVSGTFSLNYYTVTYLVDGEVYQTASVAYGARLTAIAAPVKEGYTFSGWSTMPETMPAHDVTVSGSFAINQYTLTYLVDNQVYHSETVTYGTALRPIAEPTKEGHTFSGWDNVPATMPAHDVTVNGFFVANYYLLTFLVDGAVYKVFSVAYGARTPSVEAPVKEGYEFSGWDNVPKTMPAHDVTVSGTFTLIDAIRSAQTDASAEVYTLSGQKVQTLPLRRGIYIVNGKKVVIR